MLLVILKRLLPHPGSSHRVWRRNNSSSSLCLTDDVSVSSSPAVDVCVTSEDRRYFVSETDDISNLEASVLESPRDTQLWIKLAFRYLNQSET